MAYLDWRTSFARLGEELARALPIRYTRRSTRMYLPLNGRHEMVEIFGTISLPITIGPDTKAVIFNVVPGSELFLGSNAITDFKLSLNLGTRTVSDVNHEVVSRLPFPRYSL